MENTTKEKLRVEEDGAASSRKEDHIDLAFRSEVTDGHRDNRFYYEPILSPHPDTKQKLALNIVGRTMDYPIWVSSMTGGTEKASIINENLAKVCAEYKLGMGLGSCRQLLYEDKRLEEFNIRQYIQDQPLLINLGIAQIEELIENKETDRITQLIKKLDADGLIIHVNPLQEWLQPEGDYIQKPAIDTIKTLLDHADYPIIVKEVGQGFGKESLIALLDLPLEALDLAGFGGTNFSMLELLRTDETRHQCYKNVTRLGHSCEEMIGIINDYCQKDKSMIKTKQIIISGGVKDFLDGYYLMQLCQLPSLYAQASGFLRYATDYPSLSSYAKYQIEGLKMAHAFLKIKS